MLMKVFSIFDIKAGAFDRPFFAQTVGIAIRSFTDAINDKNSPFNKYPDDFTLFELGEFDDSSGIITALPAPQSVGNAIQYILER